VLRRSLRSLAYYCSFQLNKKKFNRMEMNTSLSILPRVFLLWNARSGNSKASCSDAIEIPDLALIYYYAWIGCARSCHFLCNFNLFALEYVWRRTRRLHAPPVSPSLPFHTHASPCNGGPCPKKGRPWSASQPLPPPPLHIHTHIHTNTRMQGECAGMGEKETVPWHAPVSACAPCPSPRVAAGRRRRPRAELS
jgi:hypothetical protein